MNIKLFNLFVALGWLLTTAGAMLIHVGAGLCVGGVLMLAITGLMVKLGGVWAKPEVGT